VFRDIVVRGRHREASGSLRQRLDVEVAGRPLLRNELRLGPRWPGADGPAGAGDAHAVAQTLAVGTDGPWCTDQDRPGVRAARMTIDEGVVLLSETARDAGLLTAPYEELRDARPPSPSLPTAGVAPGRSPAPDRPAR
jgi:urease accessory protein